MDPRFLSDFRVYLDAFTRWKVTELVFFISFIV
jgi:hypothetical protein